jgi:hypothetical protein
MEQILELFKQLSDAGVNPILLNLLAVIVIVYILDAKIIPIIKRFCYPSIISKQSTSSLKIIDLLKEYQELMLSDRIAIFEFHNTTHNLYGKSFMKFTCTHEVTRLGVDSYNLMMKDIPISGYSEILKLITTNDHMRISRIDDDKLSSEYVNHCNKGNIKSVLLIPIDYRGSLYGFMSIEFTRSEDFGSVDTDEIIKNAYKLIGEIASSVCKG